MYKTIYDDGFQSYLVEGATFIGNPSMPALMDLKNTQIPKDIIPFDKAKRAPNKRAYVHFYLHDTKFQSVLQCTSKYLDLLKQFDGVISPDPTLLIGQQDYLQQTNTYLNRAVAFYLQKNGIPVIPNVRWSDESSFAYCFTGVPKESIVSVSTHGCIHTREQKEVFKKGLSKMIEVLHPTNVIVHGKMPDYIFSEYKHLTRFHRYPSEFERTHEKAGDD